MNPLALHQIISINFSRNGQVHACGYSGCHAAIREETDPGYHDADESVGLTRNRQRQISLASRIGA